MASGTPVSRRSIPARKVWTAMPNQRKRLITTCSSARGYGREPFMWISQGFGFNHTLGIEAFPNAEAYKVGAQPATSPRPASFSAKPSGWVAIRTGGG